MKRECYPKNGFIKIGTLRRKQKKEVVQYDIAHEQSTLTDDGASTSVFTKSKFKISLNAILLDDAEELIKNSNRENHYYNLKDAETNTALEEIKINVLGNHKEELVLSHSM